MLLLIAKCLFVSLVFLALRKQFRRFAKSELENIPGPPSVSFWNGALPKMYDANGLDYQRRLWRTFGRVIRLRGMIGENMLYTYDPKALQQILIEDQDTFEQAPQVIAGTTLFLGTGLLSSLGDYHKKQRKLINPAFSTSHMRQMMPIVYKIMHRFEDSIVKQVEDGPKEIDMLAWTARTALEVIGQGGLGHSFDKLSEDPPENAFRHPLKRVIPLMSEMVFLRVYALHYIVKVGSWAFRKNLVSILPWPSMKEGRNVVDLLHNTSVEIYDAKKKAIIEGTTDDEDYLSLLTKANMDKSTPDPERPSEEEIYAQIATLLFTGTESTSNTMACILWLLSKHKDVQDKLRSEIREAIENAGGREIPHDELVNLPYLDAICRETLRLYAPVWHIIRKSTKDTVLALSQPIVGVDGRKMSEIFVPKGTTVMAGLLASNQNTEIWGPDAFEWKPERWLDGLPDTVSNADLPSIFSNLMTFSAGGRSCIGFTLAILEMKAVLAVLVSRFEFSLSQDITWCMTSIASPAVAKGDPMNPQIPLMVKLAT